jgi:MFS family permease
MPVAARGLFSGVLQQGYAIGYLLAAVVNLTLVAQKDDWRPLFFVGAGLSLGAAIVRMLLPETEYVRRVLQLRFFLLPTHKGKLFSSKGPKPNALRWEIKLTRPRRSSRRSDVLSSFIGHDACSVLCL